MKHLEESHKHLEDEQDMDNQLEREFQEKQELEEKRELCLALQMDQECQMQHKPLTKVRLRLFPIQLSFLSSSFAVVFFCSYF